MDLDSQVNNLFLKSHNIVQKTAMNWRLTARNAARRDSVLAASRDYRNIIERLQVMPGADRSDPSPGLRQFPTQKCLLEPEKIQGWPQRDVSMVSGQSHAIMFVGLGVQSYLGAEKLLTKSCSLEVIH